MRSRRPAPISVWSSAADPRWRDCGWTPPPTLLPFSQASIQPTVQVGAPAMEAVVEPRQSLNGGGVSMTSIDLVRTLADRLQDTKLVVVANRQPYVHVKHIVHRKGMIPWLLRQREKVRITCTRP